MSPSHRRSLALAAAVATAAALGATAFVLPATAVGGGQAPAAVASAPMPIVNGTLDWGVLASYRSYVLNIAKGTITPADGAALNADGTFRFSSATGQYDKDGGHIVTAAFKGSVTFDAPAHGFKVTLANLRFDTGTKKLTADVTKNGTLTPDVPMADVAFGGQSMEKLGTTLTKEAAAQLGSDKYVGLAGDPLTAALQFGQPSTSPSASPSVTPSPSAPTSPSPTPSGPSNSATPSPGASSPAADGPQQLLGGRLTWGVKEGFRSYVVKGGGSVTPADGAVASGDTFVFALGKGELDVKKQKLSATFAGNLRFQRADHGVDMTFANVRINAEGKKGTLVLDVRSPTATKANVPFATLDLSKAEYRTSGGLLTLNAVPAAFTAEGAAAIGAPSPDYAEGKPTDPVTLSVSVDKDVVIPTTAPTTTPTSATGGSGGTGGTGGAVGGRGNLASTGAEVPAGALLATSGAVVAVGAGAVFLARRRRAVQI
ncbi:HtaA domain-containing protein [Streptomyces sp. NBC_01006]|uniref:HtaA domain-containing protein n=1 Tax=Streptomyces sp. NBC_01006 TaxID=2903716 RepID=UPI00386C6D69|nr:HtaA domain-containing protein [Streptomyces sp. NBC_01006]